jgi:hypothetical protein
MIRHNGSVQPDQLSFQDVSFIVVQSVRCPPTKVSATVALGGSNSLDETEFSIQPNHHSTKASRSQIAKIKSVLVVADDEDDNGWGQSAQ